MDFYDFFMELDSRGLMHTLFPFILIFTVFYAILSKANILGKDNKGANMVFSAIIALTSVILHVTGHYPTGKDPITIINDSIPAAAGLMVALVAFLVLISSMDGSSQLENLEVGSWVIGLAVLFFINFALPGVPVWIALLSALLIVIAASKEGTSHKGASGVVFIIIVCVVYIFGSNAGYFEELPYWMKNTWIQVGAIALLAFVGVVFFITRDSSD